MLYVKNSPKENDALVIVDLQYDFLPGGALAVKNGDMIIPKINEYIHLFTDIDLPVVATRDWHPANHCSFKEYGGRWPAHCIAETPGAELSKAMKLPEKAIIISKAIFSDKDAYSGLQGTELNRILSEIKVERVWVCGLATDYCVLQTVLDFLEQEFDVILLMDAIRAVNIKPEDGSNAEQRMIDAGAQPLTLNDIK
jgi:nicotinamidase/pyrazinamidase